VSGLAEKAYMGSPVWLQQIMVAAWGVGWYRRRYGGGFARLVDQFAERDNWDSQQMQDYQDACLSNLLEAAWRSPYYRAVFESAGIRGDTPPREALALIPMTPRNVLRERPNDLLTQPKLPKGTQVMKTSGTTGSSASVVYYTPEFHRLQTAVRERRCLNVNGVDYTDRRVMFGVRQICRFDQQRPPFWRFSPAEDLAYASIYHMSDQFLPYYVEFLHRYRPVVIKGIPSALRTLAHYACEHSTLPPPARCIITQAEFLSDGDREVIERAWGCRVTDEYGAVEGCVLACQCKSGRYHLSPDIGITQIVDADGTPCPPGVSGELVCTGLHNLLQPLIRYRIGDLARWSENQHCDCGYQTPVIEGIDGRVDDICWTPDGRRVAIFAPMFRRLSEIREAQVVQNRLNEFTVYVVPCPGFGSEERAELERKMHQHVGPVTVSIEIVDTIRRDPSGKFRPVVCAVSPEEIKDAFPASERPDKPDTIQQPR
jgi:phenylacetate-CoA ligase